jgi:O-antigen/teichoic acid export membrane protein
VTVGFGTAVQFALFPFYAVFTATQRFDLSNAIGITTRLVSAAAIMFALSRDGTLTGISIAVAACNVFDYVVRTIVAFRLVPQLSISLRHARLSKLRTLASFSVWSFLISISSVIFVHTDALVIGIFMPVTVVTYYALAANLIAQLSQVMLLVGHVVYPMAAQLDARGARDDLKELMLRGTRLLTLLAVGLSVIAFFWAEDFYRLWIGNEYTQQQAWGPSVPWLFRLLCIFVLFEAFSNIGGQVLLGSGRVRTAALALLSQSLCNILLSIALVSRFGVVGVAIGTLIPAFVFRAIVVPILACRVVALPYLRMLALCVPRPLLFAALMSGAALLLRHTFGSDSWIELIAHGILAVSIGAALVFTIGLASDERRFVLGAVRRK